MNTRPPLRTTHTIATMDLSRAAYDEISAKLTEAGYDHAFLDDDTIDMTGIGVTPARAPLQIYAFGAVVVEMHAGWTVTRIPGSKPLFAPWAEQPGQAETAAKIGAPSVEAMNEDHDLLHSIMAHKAGMEFSVALAYAAGGYEIAADVVAREEEMVLAIQAWLYAWHKRPEDLLDDLSRTVARERRIKALDG